MNAHRNRLKSRLTVLLLGALLGAVIWTVRGPPDPGRAIPEIHVSPAEVTQLQARWQREQERPPTPDELRKAVEDYVRDEIFYREALDRGMDRDDPRVRLTLIQTMKLLAAGPTDSQLITVEKLLSFFSLRQEQYRIPARFSVVQICFTDGEETGPGRERAVALLEQFRQQEPDPAALAEAGDRILLEQLLLDVTAPELEKRLGADVAAAVLPLPENTWAGPIPSVYGQHLVKVINRIPSRIPMLYEVRAQVEIDLRNEAMKAAEEQAYQEVAGKYRVTISQDAETMLEGTSP